jgi:hypothetical protein
MQSVDYPVLQSYHLHNPARERANAGLGWGVARWESTCQQVQASEFNPQDCQNKKVKRK